MLDQIALAYAFCAAATQQFAHRAQLMETREHLLALLFPALVLFFHHLRKVLDDIGQRRLGQHLLPQVIGFQSIRIRRVARAAVPAQVKWQEP